MCHAQPVPLSPTRAGSPRPFNVEFLHPAETCFSDHNFVLSPFIFSIFRGRGYKEKSYVFVCFWSGLGDVGITALYFRRITLVGDLLFRIFWFSFGGRCLSCVQVVVQDSFDDFQPTKFLVQCKGPRTCWSGPVVWVTSTLEALRATTVILGGPGSLHIDHLPSPCPGMWPCDRETFGGTGSIWVNQSVQHLGIHIGMDACHRTF